MGNSPTSQSPQGKQFRPKIDKNLRIQQPQPDTGAVSGILSPTLKATKTHKEILQEIQSLQFDEEIMIISDVKDLVKGFRKDHPIVWYDPEIDKKDAKYQRQLKEVGDLQIFKDIQEAISFINQSKSYCRVIITGMESFAKRIIALPNILQIYILHESPEDIKAWNVPNKRLLSPVNTLEGLVLKLMKDVRRKSGLSNSFPGFTSNYDEWDKSNINRSHYYLKGLIGFQHRHQSEQDLMKLAQEVYGDEKLEEFKKEYQGYNMQQMLKWYTKQSLVYKIINNCLKIGTSDAILYGRLLLKDMETAIKEQYEQKSKSYSGVLYRGAYISPEQWKGLEQSQGKEIEIHGFFSASKNQGRALKFLKDDIANKVFITVVVPGLPVQDAKGFAEVEEFSVFPEEEEVLFNLRTRFKVVEISVEEVNGNKYRSVVLLFGAEKLKEHVTREKRVIEIEIEEKIGEMKCKECGENKENRMYIELGNKGVVCEDCTMKSEDPSPSPLLWVNNSNIKKIEGELLLSNNSFVGYKCEKCQGKIRRRCFRILRNSTTKEDKKYCEECWKKQKKDQNRPVIMERSGWSVWTQKLSEAELRYPTEAGQGLQLQGEVYYSCENYKKAKEYFEKLWRMMQEDRGVSQETKGYVLNQLGQVYQSLGDDKKALEISLAALKIHHGVYQEGKNPLLALSYYNLGAAYDHLKEPNKALDCYVSSLEMRRGIYGENHPVTAVSYYGLGHVYEAIGENLKAQEYYMKTLEILKGIHGERHVVTTFPYISLGGISRILGQFKQAVEYYRVALEILNNNRKGKSAEIAGCCENLGEVYVELGDNIKALEYYTLAHQVYKAMYGEANPKAAGASGNLAMIYYKLGGYEDAIKLYESAIGVERSIEEEKNGRVGGLYRNLAVVYKCQGEYQKASENFLTGIEFTRKIHGEKHVEIAGLYNELGEVYEAQGELPKALGCYLIALEAYEEKKSSADTVKAYVKIAGIYENMGQYQRALEYNIILLETRKAIYGEKHIEIVKTYQRLAGIHVTLREYNKALDCYVINLQINKAIYGEKNFMTAGSFSNLASVYFMVKDYKRALDCYIAALQIYKQVYGDLHQDVAGCFLGIASIHKVLGEPQKAIECYQAVLRIYEGIYGPMYLDTAHVYINLALAWKSLGDHQKSLEYDKLSLEICLEEDKENKMLIGSLYNRIGAGYMAIGDYPKSLENHLLALDMFRCLYGSRNVDVAAIMQSIGLAYSNMNDYLNALKYNVMALRVHTLVYGEKNMMTANSNSTVAFTYYNLGGHKEALGHYTIALEIKKMLVGEKDPMLVNLYKNIAHMQRALGEETKAKEAEEKAIEIEKATVSGTTGK